MRRINIMKKNVKSLSSLLTSYLIKEGSGLAHVIDTAAQGVKSAGKEYNELRLLSKNLANYTDDVAELELALKRAGKNLNVDDVITSIKKINEIGGTSDPLVVADTIAKAKALNIAIDEAEGTADFAKNAGKTSGGAGAAGGAGAGGGAGAAGGAAGATGAVGSTTKTLTRAEFVTQEGFDAYQKLQRLEKMGASETQLASLRAKMLKAEGLEEIVDADQAFLKRMGDLDKEIAAKRTAGAIEEAERLERLKLKEAGGTKYERLKLWIKQNPTKAILLGSAAAYLAYLGFTATPSGKVVPSPTPKPGPNGGGGGGGGGTKWKKCDDTEIKKGCMGDNVRVIQSYLDNMGYDIGKEGVDSKFGSGTESALKKFQKDNGLSPTGKVNQETLDKIEEVRTGGKKTTEQTPVPEKSKEPTKETTPAEKGESREELPGLKKVQDYNVSPSGATVEEPEKIKESLIRKRNDQIEKLVFERLVKNAR